MKANQPSPPRQRPTIAQRAAAIQLAARYHRSSPPSRDVITRGKKAMVLPHDPYKERNILLQQEIPATVTISQSTSHEEEEEVWQEEGTKVANFEKSQRPRFFRHKNGDKYPRVESLHTTKSVAPWSTGRPIHIQVTKIVYVKMDKLFNQVDRSYNSQL